MTKKIVEFQGHSRFLSNFWFVDIFYEGKVYPSVEHAFQAAKTFDSNSREKVLKCRTPGQAKRMGRTMGIRPDWEEVKIDIMLYLLRIKFTDSSMCSMLLATGDTVLEEGNMWRDTFWGIYPSGSDNGKNILGELLMQVRDGIQKEVS